MFKNNEIDAALSQLGLRVREARIAKGDQQGSFAKRLGVSIPTLRALENGEPTVAVGTFVAALWALSRLADINQVLETHASLFDQVERKAKTRHRVSSKAQRA